MTRDIKALLRQYAEEHADNDIFTASDLDQLHDLYISEQGDDLYGLMCGCLRLGYMIGLNERKHG